MLYIVVAILAHPLLSFSGMIEEAFLRDMNRNGLRVTRPFTFHSYKIDQALAKSSDPNVYPVTVELKQEPSTEGGNDGGKIVSVQCKYLVGCDGGRSAVRRHACQNDGVTFEGDLTSTLWGAGDFGKQGSGSD